MTEGNSPSEPSTQTGPSLLDQIRELVASGKSLAAAGRPFDMTRDQVRDLLREHNVPMINLRRRQQAAAREEDLVDLQRQLTEARAEIARLQRVIEEAGIDIVQLESD